MSKQYKPSPFARKVAIVGTRQHEINVVKGMEEARKRVNLATELFEESQGNLPMPEKATIIEGEHGQTGIICLWDDGRVSVCVGTDSPDRAEAEKGSCYTSSKPEGAKLYYITQAHYSGMGFEMREITD